MSTITITKDWSCTRYTNGVGISNGTGFVVGMDRNNSKNNYYIMRIPIKTPSQTEQEADITSIQTNSIVFTTKGDQYDATYGVGAIGSNATSNDKIIYGLFSTNGALTDSQIRASSESFKIADTISQNTKRIECQISKTLSPDTQYYLYVFTKNAGGSYHTAWYYWPNSADVCKLILDCNYITYTKLSDPPSDNWFDSIRIKPGGSVKITAPDGVENQSSFLVSWSGAQSGSININPKQSYTFQSSTTVSRGGEITFSATRIHKVDQNYNSDPVAITSKISINRLPTIRKISTNSEKIISYYNLTSVPIDITAQDKDNDSCSTLFKVDNGAWQTSGTFAMIKNGSVITAYANDGIEDGPLAIYTVGTSTIDNLTVNSPPVLGSEILSYTFESNKIKIEGYSSAESDLYECRFLAYKNNAKVQETEWQKSIEFILSNFITTSFDKIEVIMRKNDGYDVSSSSSQEITAPGIDISTPFLNKITVGKLGTNWKIRTENLGVNNSINGHEIIIANPNDLTPNYEYNFNIIGVFNNKSQWEWQVSSESENFVKFNSLPDLSALSDLNPFEVWHDLENKDATSEISIATYSEGENEELNDVKLILNHDGNEKEIGLTAYEGTDPNTLRRTCKLRDLFDFSDINDASAWERQLLPLYGKKKIKAYFKYTKGEVPISSSATDFIMNFDYLAKPSVPSFVNPIYEKYTPKLKTDYEFATQDNIICILEIDRGEGFVEYDRQLIECQKDLNYNVDEKEKLVLPSKTLDIGFAQIKEIADTNKRKWRFRFVLENNNKCVKYSDYIETNVVKQIQPSGFQPGTVTWKEDHAIIEYSINWETNAETYEKTVSIQQGLGQISLNKDTNELKYIPPTNEDGTPTGGPYTIRLIFSTECNGNSKSKTFEAFTIYRDGPTVAYRHHHIGINTIDFPNDSIILSVQGYEQRNLILLNNNRIVQAIINCGSWDNTPSEPIPGGGSGDIPTGLAQVAYSGRLADLENDQNRIVIFVGGDSAVEDNSLA